MRFLKTVLGNLSKMEYALRILGSDDKVLANVSLPSGVPKLVAKELKVLIDEAISNNGSSPSVIMVGITESYSQETVGGDFEQVYEEDNVAIFDSMEVAEAYAEKHKLDKPISAGSFSGEVCFSKNSVLSGCCDYRLESISGLPVNPK